MSVFRPASVGCFGKLPARGDFVRAGLTEDVVAPLDLWCRECLAASRAALGVDWEQAWMSAPIWHFLLPPGACGAQSLLGAWLPSMDKAGRHYPFILCAAGDGLAQGGNWLALAEAEGLAGVVEDKPHEAIAAALARPMADAPLPPPGWWTEGSPLVRPQRFEIPGLLPATTHAGAMLRDHQAAEEPC
ncbi:MAG: type VI secretion system-associated protein TagF [Rhodospirillales bacterium]|nr:type VI secretion system-associated protein TagF [Rhodospirillales bacterium]MDE2458702.1 type VI secretion system-associated protein TagF [Rhodospirillales bacterium]